MMQLFLPFMVLPLYAVMRNIPRSLTAVAESMGATPLRSFWRVYLPLSIPGIWAGSLLVFILSAGSCHCAHGAGRHQGPGDRVLPVGDRGVQRGSRNYPADGDPDPVHDLYARLIGFGSIYGAGEALIRSSSIETSYRAPRRVPLNLTRWVFYAPFWFCPA